MKVYQLIYTSVKCSLSDPELGLSNRAGMTVFSCTQGLTRQNIQEIVRFATYRLPRNNEIEYSETPCDPSVPELFPKIFRTFKLSDGRYAAMQVSYAGYDFDGQPGNVFAHAFVFDEVDDEFMPEKYCNHPLYRTHLREKDISGQIVHYLKPLDDIEPTEGLEESVIAFIHEHKNELTHILDKALQMLTTEEISNLCIATGDAKLTEMYMLALKWLLPRDGAENLGISTYNVYLPSDKQKQIVFHGTIKGRNNITQQAVDVRTNCIYIDVDNARYKRDIRSILFRFDVEELREVYRNYKFTSPAQLLAWEATWENTTKAGIAAKLLKLKKLAGDDAFHTRVMEIYPAINDFNMANVRFELCEIMYDNIHLFETESKKIIAIYMEQCFEKICAGEEIKVRNPFRDSETAKELGEAVCGDIGKYMETIRINFDNIPYTDEVTLLQLLGYIKHAAEKQSWRELFKNEEDLKLFVLMASHVIITGTGINAFANVDGWERSDLSELVAYFDASTNDKAIKDSCLKYIFAHNDEDWSKYGVTLKSHEKPADEQASDLEKIRRMLSKVGYIPYQRGTYADIRDEVTDDVRSSNSPLLLSRLLSAVYHWQSTYGNQIEAERDAGTIKELLLEMRKTQLPCYNFIIPKLALEIIESQGHYHEIMINAETMPQGFWNWFVIGCERCRRNDDKLLSYTRVYTASKDRIPMTPAKKKLRDMFRDVVE